MRVVWHLSDARQDDLRQWYPPILHAHNVMMMSTSVPRNDLMGHPKVLVVMVRLFLSVSSPSFFFSSYS